MCSICNVCEKNYVNYIYCVCIMEYFLVCERKLMIEFLKFNENLKKFKVIICFEF